MKRAACVLVLMAATGCEPGFPLPSVQNPTAANSWPVPPDPNGPCLQITHLRRRGTWVWKHGAEQPGSVDQATLAATADDPPAHALMLRSVREERAVLGVVFSGLGVWFATFGTEIALNNPKGDQTVPIAIGVVGGSVFFGSFAAAISLGIAAGQARTHAVEIYNAHAAEHGCN